MAEEVHVTTSQADAARLIVQRDSANGKSTSEAIRKIAAAHVQPAAETARGPGPEATASGERKARWRALLATVTRGRAASGRGSSELSPPSKGGIPGRKARRKEDAGDSRIACGQAGHGPTRSQGWPPNHPVVHLAWVAARQPAHPAPASAM